MTPQEIQIKVAEECGWTFPCKHCAKFGHTSQWRNPEDTGCVEPSQLPPYTTSLDAIQKAALERFNDAVKQASFMDNLNGRAWSKSSHVFSWQLTALDWCEAFVKTCEELNFK